MSEIRLKPCPFCDGKVRVDSRESMGYEITFILCNRCGACVSYRGRESLRRTVKAWNRRAE